MTLIITVGKKGFGKSRPQKTQKQPRKSFFSEKAKQRNSWARGADMVTWNGEVFEYSKTKKEVIFKNPSQKEGVIKEMKRILTGIFPPKKYFVFLVSKQRMMLLPPHPLQKKGGLWIWKKGDMMGRDK